jgi:hypothetical protein
MNIQDISHFARAFDTHNLAPDVLGVGISDLTIKLRDWTLRITDHAGADAQPVPFDVPDDAARWSVHRMPYRNDWPAGFADTPDKLVQLTLLKIQLYHAQQIRDRKAYIDQLGRPDADPDEMPCVRCDETIGSARHRLMFAGIRPILICSNCASDYPSNPPTEADV